jgi:hypothetical protein
MTAYVKRGVEMFLNSVRGNVHVHHHVDALTNMPLCVEKMDKLMITTAKLNAKTNQYIAKENAHANKINTNIKKRHAYIYQMSFTCRK